MEQLLNFTKNGRIFLKLSLVLAMLSPIGSTAQDVPLPPLEYLRLDEFEYNDEYYEITPKGLTFFLKEANGLDADLKKDLRKKLQSIKTRKTASDLIFLASLATSIYIGFNDNRDSDTEGLEFEDLTFLVPIAVGGGAGSLLRPGKKDYHDFINTFNRRSKTKLNLVLGSGLYENLNLGIVINL